MNSSQKNMTSLGRVLAFISSIYFWFFMNAYEPPVSNFKFLSMIDSSYDSYQSAGFEGVWFHLFFVAITSLIFILFSGMMFRLMFSFKDKKEP